MYQQYKSNLAWFESGEKRNAQRVEIRCKCFVTVTAASSPTATELPSEGKQGSRADWAVCGRNGVSARFSLTDEKSNGDK